MTYILLKLELYISLPSLYYREGDKLLQFVPRLNVNNFFFFLLNKDFIAQKIQPETGETQKDRAWTHL